jgi:LytS/YehU family sensor histidine kinase
VGWLAHLGAVTGIGLADAAWGVTLEILLNPWAQSAPPGTFLEMWLTRFSYGQLTSVVLYAFILTIDRVLESQQSIAVQKVEAAQLSEQLYKARLDALRRQLEPHFLFNSLNAVSGLIRNGRGDAAVETVVALGEFLRSVAEDSHCPQVRLEQEMHSLQRYLQIQRARFAERLQVTLDIPEELLSAQVPSLVLQPLVENAIRHGIARLPQGGAIRVTAAHSNGALSLSVANDGPSLSSDWETRSSGIGVSNLRARLNIMYGSGSELSLRNRDTGGVEARVSLPFSRI